MTAAAHFMTDRYVGFDVPGGRLAALAVALRLLADELEKARRILERRQPAGGAAGRRGRRSDERRAVASTPAAPTRPPIANDRNRVRRLSPSTRLA